MCSPRLALPQASASAYPESQTRPAPLPICPASQRREVGSGYFVMATCTVSRAGRIRAGQPSVEEAAASDETPMPHAATRCPSSTRHHLHHSPRSPGPVWSPTSGSPRRLPTQEPPHRASRASDAAFMTRSRPRASATSRPVRLDSLGVVTYQSPPAPPSTPLVAGIL